VKKLGIAAGALLVLAIGAYAWLWFSPAPELPALGGTLTEETVGARTYLAYLPKDLPADAPLLIVLHGSSMNGASMRKWTAYEFDALADAKKLAVVYPFGFKSGWNDCRTQANHAARVEHIDDVAFLKTVIAQMHDTHHTAATGVFVFGYSNGGHMAYRLAFEAPQLIAAIATQSANLPSGENQGCTVKGPTPRVLLSAGTDDPLVPFNGGMQSLFGLVKRGTVMSADESAETFAKLNSLDAPTVVPRRGSVSLRTWSRDGTRQVVQLTVHGAGHTVPQAGFRFPRLLGETARDFDLPRAAVDFFTAP
jgi:polyhydroxybutyrate depolymerase